MNNSPLSKCPVCDSKAWNKVYEDELGSTPPTVDYRFSPQTRKTYQVVECCVCTHRYVHPQPKLDGLYEANQDPTYLSSIRQRRRSAQEWVQIVEAFNIEAVSLLDIGCATGVFLDEAAKRYTVEGIELSHWAADVASRSHIVHRKPVSEAQLRSTFDIATLWGVIEHLECPKRELTAINAVLNDYGTLFIYTGNRSALIPRILGKRWWWYQGMHIQYFSDATLSRILAECGFRVIAKRNLPIYFSVRSLGQSLNRYKFAKPLVWLMQRLPTERLLIRVKVSGEMLIVAQKLSGNRAKPE